MSRLLCCLLCSLPLWLLACGDDGETPTDATVATDGSSTDAAGQDTGSADAGHTDADPSDLGRADADLPDADLSDVATDAGSSTVTDAGLADADLPDVETDAGSSTVTDAGLADADIADADLPDLGVADAGVTDAGPTTCTVAPNSCTNGEVCLGESCSCIQALHGNHYLRTDGTVVYALGAQTVITVAGGAQLSGITEIYTGWRYGCGLKNDGTVWCWPLDSSADTAGQLGDGTPSASVPTQDLLVATEVLVSANTPLTNVDHISRGSSRSYLASSTCAVRQDGTLWCWGTPDSSGGGGGTLFNDGVLGSRAYAVEILAAANTSLTGVQAVSMGTRHYCLIRNGTNNGEVWCWGANIGGPLGQGDQVGRQYPVQVTLPGPAEEVGAGADATCARVADAVYCWGSNNSGQVGIGVPSAPGNHDGCINFCKLTPARVLDDNSMPLDGIDSLNVAYLSVCAKKADHSLWCWGGTNNLAAVTTLAGTPLTNVALHTTSGASGYAQSLIYLNRDKQFFRTTVPVTPLCP